MVDNLNPEQRRRAMSRVRTRDTAPELMLRRGLYQAGFRGWRVDWRAAPGRPDIAWPSRRIAVFVDGAFWHGHPDHYWGQSGAFWTEKINQNRDRDARNNAELRRGGWALKRFWDFEVERDLQSCVEQVGALLALRPSREGS